MLNVIGVMVRAFPGPSLLIVALIAILPNLARDYVEGMWLILQQDKPEDFVLATGETHRVREFVEKSFGLLDMPIK
jgi:hypothetical protein